MVKNTHLYGTLTLSFMILKVWIGFLLSTTCFILITTAIIKIQERSENKEDNPKSIRETIYLQLEYVLSIIAGQGK